MLKRTIHSAALVVFPRSGHLCNLEEPELFNRTLTDFYGKVDGGTWTLRDPRSLSASITGIEPDEA